MEPHESKNDDDEWEPVMERIMHLNAREILIQGKNGGPKCLARCLRSITLPHVVQAILCRARAALNFSGETPPTQRYSEWKKYKIQCACRTCVAKLLRISTATAKTFKAARSGQRIHFMERCRSAPEMRLDAKNKRGVTLVASRSHLEAIVGRNFFEGRGGRLL
jgi:hypothetical protein